KSPPGSLDDCERHHKAADDKGNNEGTGLYASKANMGMVCKHDRPLFVADIKTPGEQQFYSIALIRQLASYLPPNATIGILYDIGCQLDRSIAKHNLIPEIAPWISCATAIFHSYAHQFCCQILYNPRRRPDFGWANGE
ncbi:hypothetical protein M422DRAFT_87068, partial [Sphaerobolus stellatus SS14]